MRKIAIIFVILITLLLIGCYSSTYETDKYAGENPFISESPKDDTTTQQKTQTTSTESGTGVLASQTKSWLKVNLVSIKENTDELIINFQLENLGEEYVENVMNPNGPDTVWVEFDLKTSERGFVESKTGFCPSLYNKEVPNCSPLNVFVNIPRPTSFEKFTINYQPIMWFNYAENSLFYMKKENNKFISVSKEDFHGVKLQKDDDIPTITYNEMLKLKPDTDIRVCTQNFFGDELTTCLTVLARGNNNPEICEYATEKSMELECKRRILHSFSSELNVLQNSGVNVLSLCEELPEDNNEIGHYGKTCFEVIKQAGIS